MALPVGYTVMPLAVISLANGLQSTILGIAEEEEERGKRNAT